ncbi:hypothetical protein C8F01DRAFT_1105217 [Mycena amicta]|nr:hypothetical protein C8F01DRAFT_1105217 [Mycena amicta]
MSAPFHYSPQAEYFPPQHWGYPYTHHETIYPSSPAGWQTPQRRRRRDSWHGSSAPPVVPFIPPSPTMMEYTPASPRTMERLRAWAAYPEPSTPFIPATPPELPPWNPDPDPEPLLTWDASPEPPVVPRCLPPPGFPSSSHSSYVPSYPRPPAPLHIHPWLNGEMPNELSFDLALTAFAPSRIVGPEQRLPLGAMDIQQPAFYPAVTRLRIVCDAIPDYPVDVVYPGGLFAPPPITLGDILVAVHKTMHQSITHHDWDRLSVAQEAAVSRTFTRRCRMDAELRRAAGHVPDEMQARRQGVKVVDFLSGLTMFRGLVRAEDGSVKMVVSQ